MAEFAWELTFACYDFSLPVTCMTVRFGDFELDTTVYRITRNGEDLRLAKQPLDLLILLLDRRGELVTREEIAAALWGNPDQSGAEHSINTTVRRVRAALEDDPASPRYIETVPRRGYRFIATVDLAPVDLTPVGAGSDQVEAAAPKRVRSMWPIWVIGLAAVFGVAAFGGIYLTWQRQAQPQLTWRPITKSVYPVEGLASDGRSVFWTEYAESGSHPWQAPLDGSSDATPVATPFPSAFVLDATPQGQLLLVVRENCRGISDHGCEGPICEITLASRQVSWLRGITASHAAISPNGRRIAFSHWNELWLANRDGSAAHRIASLSGGIHKIHWSPGGIVVRFTMGAHSEYGYPQWEVDIESGRARPLLPKFAAMTEPMGGDWTQDGGFVFASQRATGIDLWMLAPAAWPSAESLTRQLTRGPLDFFGPVAVPGRKELAVIGARKQGELERFDSHGQKFIPFLGGISAEMTDFSRDGRWVAYVTYPEGDLRRRRIDGSEDIPLTHGPLHAGLPRISPDNKLVAFTGDYSGKQLRTWLVPLESGEPRPATRWAPGTAELAPTWSPDSSKLLYRLDQADKKNVLQIVDLSTGFAETVPDSMENFNQRWSPDGKFIAATPNDEKGLYVFDLERGEWSNLTAMRADYPNWSHDGKAIYFCSYLENGEEGIFRVSLSTRKVELVTRLAGTRRAMNEMYTQWAGLAPDDSPLILRSADLQQIYLLSLGGS
jgi:Tol biopolymer transport system component/DNA-binding winged helix-turn-helix (wHTH) protein